MNEPALAPVFAPFFNTVTEAPEGARVTWVTTGDGVRIRVAVWSGGARGTAVLFSGRTEFVEKYGRVIGRLRARDLSVVAFDWRGQGLSDRLGANPMLGHVQDFRDYQKDWAAVRGAPLVADLPRPFHLFAHSMGGCIGLRTLLEGTDFAAAVMSAPMWHLQMRTATRQITNSLAQLASFIGLGGRLKPGTSREPSALALDFRGNVLTSDAEHFGWFVRQLTVHPELGLGGPSLQWTYAALEEMARLYMAPLPILPVLAFVGTEESVVSTSVIRGQMAKMPNGRLIVLPSARHEIWMEAAAIQATVWTAIDAFLSDTRSHRPQPGHPLKNGELALPIDGA